MKMSISVENCLNKIKNNLWYKKYKLDLLSNDYPERIDESLKHKSIFYTFSHLKRPFY